MNRKTLVTAAVAGALGLVVVTAPAVASGFGAAEPESTSVVIPGGVVTDVVMTDEVILDRNEVVGYICVVTDPDGNNIEFSVEQVLG